MVWHGSAFKILHAQTYTHAFTRIMLLHRHSSHVFQSLTLQTELLTGCTATEVAGEVGGATH